jgi:glycerophosphoryl diester phosphodiesterase
MDLLKSQTNRILIESHRGVEHTHPENSWPAIKTAQSEKADFIEVDVQLSADGVPFIRHNYTFPDGRWSHELAWREIKSLRIEDEIIPSLQDLINWACDEDVRLSLDIKPGFHPFGRLSKQITAQIEAMQAWNRVMLIAWDHHELLEIKKSFPNSVTRILYFGRPVNLVETAKAANCNAVGLSYGVTRPEDVSELHENGIAVAFGGMWNFDLEVVQELDVDIVSWGHPAQAREILGIS